MIMMKKKIIQGVFIYLSMCVLISCVTQRTLFFTNHATVRLNDNSIESNGQPILRIAQSVLNLEEKKLIFERDSLSKNAKIYIYDILRECHSSQDTLIVISQDFIVLKGLKTSHKPDANYMYNFDSEIGRWVCSYIAVPTEDIPSVDKSCVFFRKVYVVERRNRIIIKDYFGDISVIYVIQGKDKKAIFNTTSVWSPSEFPALITTTNYIREKLDPISYNIAKNKYFNQTNRL